MRTGEAPALELRTVHEYFTDILLCHAGVIC